MSIFPGACVYMCVWPSCWSLVTTALWNCKKTLLLKCTSTRLRTNLWSGSPLSVTAEDLSLFRGPLISSLHQHTISSDVQYKPQTTLYYRPPQVLKGFLSQTSFKRRDKIKNSKDSISIPLGVWAGWTHLSVKHKDIQQALVIQSRTRSFLIQPHTTVTD